MAAQGARMAASQTASRTVTVIASGRRQPWPLAKPCGDNADFPCAIAVTTVSKLFSKIQNPPHDSMPEFYRSLPGGRGNPPPPSRSPPDPAPPAQHQEADASQISTRTGV